MLKSKCNLMKPTTKLLLSCRCSPYIDDIVFNIKDVKSWAKFFGYDFEVDIPTVVSRPVMKKGRRFFGFGKEIDVLSHYNVFLDFDRELNEQELRLWRMFKLGWIVSKMPMCQENRNQI